MEWNDDITLRRWQADALDEYKLKHEIDQRNFVCVVTPAGGKTIFSCAVANYLFEIGAIKQVVVVVHTDNLRTQWVDTAGYAGLNLCSSIDDPVIRNEMSKRRPSFLAGGYEGVVLTYQQLSSRAADVARCVRRKSTPTLVIIDEVHHAGDSKSWGDALKAAFKKSHRRLLLSGTMFRNDNSKIPFIKYYNGIGYEDYAYIYSEALSDGVVSPIYFPTYGGIAKWRVGEEEFEHTFSSELSHAHAQRQLNAALENDKWLQVVLRDFHGRLTDIQSSGHPEAKGLIVAKSQKHARKILSMIDRISGRSQRLAISDVDNAHEIIRNFGSDKDADIIVSVGMVTEGIDYPDLRVGCYLTNVTSELTFRQVVGRLTRLHDGEGSQSVFLYLPRNALLLRYAKDIASKRQNVINDQSRSFERSNSTADIVKTEYMSASAERTSTLLPGGEFSDDELAFADILRKNAGLGHLTVEEVAQLVRTQQKMSNTETPR